MTKYKIVLCSKDRKSLNNFLKLLKYETNAKNLQILSNISKKKKWKKKISVLKSPHVNKIAQEQFEFIYYSIRMYIYSWEIKKYTFILKKIKTRLFPGIRIKIKGDFSKKERLIRNKIFHPKNVRFHLLTGYPIIQESSTQISDNFSISLIDKNLLKKTITYLKTLDCHGTRIL